MEVSLISEEKHHCAAPTWNGFVYQGKIALIVVLDLLLGQDQNWQDYALELEWREDFSIKNQERYISIHQVKCKGGSGAAEYQEAVDKLLANIYQTESLEEPTTLPIRCLHTACSIISPEWNGITLYDYGAGKCFMPIEFIDKELLSRISNYLNKIDPENSGNRGTTFYDRCLLYLCNKITAKIQDIHRINHTGVRVADIDKRIPFEEIIATLQKNYNANSEDYYTFRIKETFNKAFENFFSENNITEELSKEQYTKLCVYSSLINCLANDKFRHFCLAIFPGADIIEESGFPEHHAHIITDNFCEILSHISLRADIADKDYKLQYHKGGANYLPTSLGDKKLRIINELRKNIHKDAYLRVLYEVRTIITKSVSFASLGKELGHIMNIQNLEHSSEIREKINQIQAIEMIDRVAAKQRIDTDD
ncbi:hypothetical protein GU926_11100 [Nibribacter ruber]|uniref:ABC-three component systems C-terminal domain-containing protein n=1 Tax=Nibribacter ruber TaxID=2698458 RepID=A0A6P1P0N6_9BACT|nr:ABC-three component system protein [Nibribacter ruber]QHL87948.1 hypothetical protein GU926_11100 [Nibribacter ruber]